MVWLIILYRTLESSFKKACAYFNKFKQFTLLKIIYDVQENKSPYIERENFNIWKCFLLHECLHGLNSSIHR